MAGAATALGLASLAWRTGARGIQLLGSGRRSGSGRPLAEMALGFAALGTLTFALGLTGLLYPPPRPVAVVLLGALAVKDGMRLWGKSPGLAWAGSLLGQTSLPTRLILACALLLALAGAFNIEMAWDALTYHLRLPTFYLYRHKIYDVWHHYYAPFPFLVEMLYLLGLSFHGELVARLLNALFGVSLLVATRSLALLAGCRGNLSAILVLASPLVLMLMGKAYVDLGFALFLTLSLCALLRWRATGSRASLAESALLAGCGMSSKYVGLLIVPAYIAAAAPLFLGRTKMRPPAPFGTLALAGAFALLPFAPWLLKNALLAGNPLTPIFGGLHETSSPRPHYIMAILDSGFRPLELFRAIPPRFLNLLFHDGLVDGPLGPAAVGALPLLLLRPSSAALSFIRRTVLAYTIIWILLYPDARFFLPALPALAVIIEEAATRRLPLSGRLRLALRILAEAGVCAGALFAVANQWIFFSPLSMPLGLENQDSILRVGLPPPPFHFYAREFINENLPRRDRILHLCNFSTYYIERESIGDFHFGSAHVARFIREGGDAEGIHRKMKQRGLRWLLHASVSTRQYLNIPGFFDVPEKGWGEFKKLLARRGEVAWQTDGYVLYRLGPRHPPISLPSLPVYEEIVFHAADRALAEGRAREAIRSYLSPPKLLSDVGSTQVRKADAYMLMQDFSRAADSFSAALVLGSDNPRVNLGLAQAALALDRPAAGLPYARRALSQNPYSGQVAVILAITNWKLGEAAKAREQLENARRLSPQRTEFRALARQWAMDTPDTRAKSPSE